MLSRKQLILFQRELFPYSLSEVFSERWARWFPGAAEVLDHVNWEEVRELLIKLRGPLTNAIWKTLTGSWITTMRFHDNIPLQCCLGCEAPDSFVHYWCCPKFIFLLQAVLDSDVHYCPICRSGVFLPTISSLSVSAAAYLLFVNLRSLFIPPSPLSQEVALSAVPLAVPSPCLRHGVSFAGPCLCTFPVSCLSI